MTPIEAYNTALAKRVIDNLEKRNMEGYYCANKEEALKKALELIPEGSSVTWGGSQSIIEIGLCESLKNGNFKAYDRTEAKNNEERQEIMRKAFFCDFYLTSSNAVTEDGKLVNIDGNGNRVSAMIFGPENVLMLVGINKICKTEEEAISRVKNKAAIINAFRLKTSSACTKVGKCVDCLNEDCICSVTVVTRKSLQKGRIKIILVGEELGY